MHMANAWRAAFHLACPDDNYRQAIALTAKSFTPPWWLFPNEEGQQACVISTPSAGSLKLMKSLELLNSWL